MPFNYASAYSSSWFMNELGYSQINCDSYKMASTFCIILKPFTILQGAWNCSCWDASYCNLQSVSSSRNVPTPCERNWRGIVWLQPIVFTQNLYSNKNLSYIVSVSCWIMTSLSKLWLHVPKIYLILFQFLVAKAQNWLFFVKLIIV